MSLNHTILGLLSRESLTGYEMKKIIQGTPFMYWSGNNNQIYKAFVELLDRDFVTKEVKHQEGSPSKNIYTITECGLKEFNNWLLSETDIPAFKKQFLIKLSLANKLNRDDLENILTSYEDIVNKQLFLSEKELEKCYFAREESLGKSLFADLIQENILSFYSGELIWIQKVKEFISKLPNESGTTRETTIKKERNNKKHAMNYEILQKEGKKYIYFTGDGSLILSEKDTLDIISLCVENDTNAIILAGDMFSDSFIKSKIEFASDILQKFVTYNIKVAVAIKDEKKMSKNFKEIISETMAKNTFKVFTNLEDAIGWILV